MYRLHDDDLRAQRRWRTWIAETSQMLSDAPPRAATAWDGQFERILNAMWKATASMDYRALFGGLRAYQEHVDYPMRTADVARATGESLH